MCEYINHEVLHYNATRTGTLDLWKNEFLKYTKVKPIQNLHIVSSTNFDNDSLAIALSEERVQIKDLKDSRHYHIGRMFFPLRERKSFYIIIDDRLFNNGWRALSTFIHEFTHAIDYRNFMIYASYTDRKYNYNIKEHPLYNIMYKWGEFHANYVQRIFSMLFLTMKYPKQYTREYFRHYILQEEISSSNYDLIESFKDNKLPIIDLFIYLGRYLAYEAVLPSEFADFRQIPKHIFDSFKGAIIPLYHCLSSHNNFCNTFANLESLSELKSIVPELSAI